MINIWLVILLSTIVACCYIWLSVTYQSSDSKENSNSKGMLPLILPVSLLAIAPLLYFNLGNVDKQYRLDNALEMMTTISEPEASIGKKTFKGSDLSDIELEDLILGLRAACAQQPGNGELWFMLAEAYFQLNMVDLADAAISRAIRIEARPNWLVANAQILALRASEADLHKSIRLLERAVYIQPQHQSALLTLGFLHLRMKQFQQAVDTWLKLQTILRDNGNSTVSLEKQIEFARNQLKNK